MKDWSKPRLCRFWRHRGLDLLTVETDMGHHTGYVRIPSTHPYFRLDYTGVPEAVARGRRENFRAWMERHSEEIRSGLEGFQSALTDVPSMGGTDDSPESVISVHGGITFSAWEDWSHLDGDGVPEGWWMGWDAAHYGDAKSPDYLEWLRVNNPSLWDIEQHWPTGGHYVDCDEVAAENERFADELLGRLTQPTPVVQ